MTFSEPLDSLDSSEVEIRHAKSNRLFSIESVRLSSDGTFADVILYGSNDSDGTTFLQANQPYICTLTKDGETASLGFEIPGFVSDAYVKSVDVEKGTIKVGNSGRTAQSGVQNENGSYILPSSYTGNLGTLVGNTVSFYYDADLNISDFEVQDQVTAIGAYKYNIPSGAQDWDDCYFSLGDEKYYLRETSTASSNSTHVYSIYDGSAMWPQKNQVYQYAKLVLNPDGTVAQAALLPAWTEMIFATSIDGNVVTESKSRSKDFDGFTIVKDDAYITTADLEEGDVIYYYEDEDEGVKFAEVYNDEVSGDLTKTYNKTAILDGTSYTYIWNDAYAGRTNGQYVKDGKYVALEEKVLQDYEDDEEVTFTLNRLGNVVKAEGTTGEEVSTTTEYMLTANAIGYTTAGTNYISFKVSDGTSKSTIVVDPTGLKKINGVTLAGLKTAVPGDAGKLNNKVYVENTTPQDDTADLIANYDKDDPAAGTNIAHFINEDLGDVFPAGTLLKVTTDEDGNITALATSVSQNVIDADAGAETVGDTAAADFIAQTTGGSDQVFKAGLTTIVTDGGKKLSISDDAEVWTAKADFSTVTKTTYAEFTGTSLKAQNANVLIVPSGTTVKQVVILDSKATLGDAEVASKEWGVVTESLTGRVDADNTNVLKKLTVLAPSGEKVVYENIKKGLAGQDKGSIVYVELDSSDQVIRINNAADMAADGVAIAAESVINKAEATLSDGKTDFDKNSTLKDTTNGKWVVEAADGAVVAKYDGNKVTTTTISAINNEDSMKDYTKFIYNTVRVNNNDVEASVIVALKGEGAVTGETIEVATADELEEAAAFATAGTTIVITADIEANDDIDTDANIEIAEGCTLTMDTKELDCADLTVNGRLTTKDVIKPDGDITIGTNGQLDILGTGTLTIAAGKTLTNNGLIRNAGIITNNGTITNKGTITNTNTIAQNNAVTTTNGLADGTWKGKAPSDAAATYIGKSDTNNTKLTTATLTSTYGTALNEVVGYQYDQYGLVLATAAGPTNITSTGKNAGSGKYTFATDATGKLTIASLATNSAGTDTFTVLDCAFTSTIAPKAVTLADLYHGCTAKNAIDGGDAFSDTAKTWTPAAAGTSYFVMADGTTCTINSSLTTTAETDTVTTKYFVSAIGTTAGTPAITVAATTVGADDKYIGAIVVDPDSDDYSGSFTITITGGVDTDTTLTAAVTAQ